AAKLSASRSANGAGWAERSTATGKSRRVASRLFTASSAARACRKSAVGKRGADRVRRAARRRLSKMTGGPEGAFMAVQDGGSGARSQAAAPDVSRKTSAGLRLPRLHLPSLIEVGRGLADLILPPVAHD